MGIKSIDIFQQALQAQQSGFSEQALQLYQQVLLSEPQHIQALLNSGFIYHQQKEYGKALNFFNQVLSVEQNSIDALFSLGAVYQQQSDFEKAESFYSKVLKLQPQHVKALYNLATIIELEKNDSQLALEYYSHCLEIQNNFHPARIRIADIYYHLKLYGKAKEQYLLLDSLIDNSAHIMTKLGQLSYFENNYSDAIQYYLKAIQLSPQNIALYNNLGIALMDNHQLQEAESIFLKAISFGFSSAEMSCNLANLYKKMKKLDLAFKYYQDSVDINPQYSGGYLGLGNYYADKLQMRLAFENYEQALKLAPRSLQVNHNLGLFYQTQGKVKDALRHLKAALKDSDLLSHYGSWCNYLFSLYYDIDLSAQEIFQEVRSWGQYLEEKVDLLPLSYQQKKRLRIGFISPDFRRHAAAYFLPAFYQNRTRTEFEIFSYSDVLEADKYTELFKELSDHWYDTFHLTAFELAQLIASHQIDILIDPGMGHTANNRLLTFAHKPAPVQMTTFPATTGLSRMDYRMTDPFLDSQDKQRELNTEKLVYIPHSVSCYCPSEDAPDVSVSPFQQNQYITFGCFNNLSKLNYVVIELWAKILKALPSSQLVLKSPAFRSSDICKSYLEQFCQHQIEDNRIRFLSLVDTTREHLDLYNQIDIALDPFPYNGITTTCDALWMGVPVVTLAGEHHFGRVAKGYLELLDLPELVARDLDEYQKIAVTLATQSEKLSALRANLRQLMADSFLCNQKNYIENLEHIYREIWSKFVASKSE